jgi:TPP-dependent pyruvate/acetoin dehydrogenase alpha subunit
MQSVMRNNGENSDGLSATASYADLVDDQFFLMQIIRRTESKLLSLFSENKIFGTTHTSIGQELNALAVVQAIDLGRDIIWSNHRCHGHFLAYTRRPDLLFAEIMGRQLGVCGGRGGSQHLCFRNFYSNGIQGGGVPIAVGCALAGKGSGAIVVVFIGDGTLGQGVIYESMNMAALWDVPILFVVEDNGIAQTTPSSRALAGRPETRARTFGIREFSGSYREPDALLSSCSEAVNYVRENLRPAWLYLESLRLGPHSKGDDTRSAELLSDLRLADPMIWARSRVVTPDAIEHAAETLVNDALRIAEASLPVGGIEK